MRLAKIQNWITAARTVGIVETIHTDYQIRKAKRIHIKAHPVCEITGLKPSFFQWLTGYGLEVHHIIPVHVSPNLSCDQDNLITLIRSLHFVVGHCWNWRKWNSHIEGTIVALRVAFKEYAMVCSKTEKGVEVLTIAEAVNKGEIL